MLAVDAQVFRRFARNRSALLGGLLTGVLLATAVFAPVLAPRDPLDQSFPQQLQPPSWRYPLGTDEFGRDMLSRIIFGARIALGIGGLAVGIAVALGVPFGLVAGYFGGRLDTAIMRTMDVLLAFPYLLLALIVVTLLGFGLTNVMIAVGLVYVPQYSRIVRSVTLSVRERLFVEAAHAMGGSTLRIMFRHVLPNCLAPIIVQTTLSLGWAIVNAAGLSFLGLGAQPPTPEWGAMLTSGREYMRNAPWITTFPGLAILLTALGFNLLGDGLRDALDPRLKD
jgi:peptide/nickel transport system permease protein